MCNQTRARRSFPRSVIASISFVLVASGVLASTITVNSTADTVADDGACTLREALVAANNNMPSGAMAGECVAGEAAPTVDAIHFDQLQKAKMHNEQAELLCHQVRKRLTRNALRPAINKVTQFLATLASRKAKTISPTVKGTLRTSADAIRTDMQALQRAVRCPQDAPPA
jgi:CSLREA domain-containing protein